MCTSTLERLSDGEVIELPCEFNVSKPYIKKKRKSVKTTSKAVFVQTSTPLYVHGEDGFDWKIDLATRKTAQILYELYCEDEIFRYTGCMGEIFLVELRDAIKWSQFKCGLPEISGKMHVYCIEKDYDLLENCGG